MPLSIRDTIVKFIQSPSPIFNKNGVAIEPKVIQHEYYKIKKYLYREHKEGDVCALFLNNDYRYFLAIFACMDLGLCYIPMREDWPKARVDQINKITNFKTLLTDDLLASIITSCEHEDSLSFNVLPTSPLYIMFTSGTTGAPKGVIIQRKSYDNFINWVNSNFNEINNSDRLLNSTNYTFDVSLMELALLLTKKVNFYMSNATNVLNFAKELHLYKITISVTVPINFSSILTERFLRDINLKNLKSVLLAGEKIPLNLYQRFRGFLPDIHLYNCYGPTEATIYCLYKKLMQDEFDVNDKSISIGSPLPGCLAMIVNEHNQELGIEEEGELVIGGNQVMQEYLNRPEETEKALIKINQKVYYKTGDIAYVANSDNFYVRGRLDDTIKVSGQRVNLSNIDQYISELTYIKACVSIAIEDKNQNMFIRSFLILDNKDIRKSVIMRDMKKLLLKQQIPKEIIILNEMPLGSSGKVDKKQLRNFCK